MIDVHSHIIPNIDDGSKSIEETFNLIKEARSVGFDAIISTSHYIEKYYETPENERKEWISAIQEALENQKEDIKLFLGNEIYITDNIVKLIETKKASTINNTNYLLFEMPLNAKPLDLINVIYSMQEHGLKPILAHPERYSFVQTNPEIIYDLIEKGVLMQSNYASIIGQYGNKAQMIVKKFFENNMIHMLGSDVHKQNTIYPKIPQILKILTELIGEEKLTELTTTNPLLVLNNKEIDIDQPTKFRLSFKEKLNMAINKKRA